ncbi:hypothetical protein [Pontivivens ytuae]|uniref:Uncharacterized protein n=1 Tax=Pontivivens ytuae TaxID=2789856 RepID=A0A7S9LRH5_9RHOB|nr:hypothetical protein [Pontivivens ytuae]QPH53939.1 hypothetical protein I0K15_19555 [Pontivivens ytuae]
MGRFLAYLFVFALLVGAGFAVYAIIVPPEAPRAPVEIDIDLQAGG